MRKLIRRIAAAAVAFTAVFAFNAVAATPAQAVSAYGCNWPYFCVYDHYGYDSPIVRRYQDVTSDWQWFGTPEVDYAYWNTRNDDAVLLLVEFNGARWTSCSLPNSGGNSPGRLLAIRISWSPTC